MRPYQVASTSLALVLLAAVPARADEDVYVEEDDEEVGVYIAIDAEMFGGGAYTRTSDDRMTRFDIDRAEVGTRLDYGDTVTSELRLETVRPEDDDALTVRAKRAWGAWREERKRRKRPSFEVRGGLIPEPWIEAVESGYELRALAPTAAEHAGLIEHADFGVATVAIWKMVRMELAVTNGEGLSRELNNGKNVSGLISMRMPRLDDDTIVTAHFYGRGGTRGMDGVRSHRVGTALTVDSPKYGGGGEMVSAWGVGEADDVSALTGGLWMYATLKGRNGVAGRVDWTNYRDDLDNIGKHRTATLSVWRDLIPRGGSRVRDFGVRSYLAVQHDRVGAMPETGMPMPVDAVRVMVILQASARETM